MNRPTAHALRGCWIAVGLLLGLPGLPARADTPVAPFTELAPAPCTGAPPTQIDLDAVTRQVLCQHPQVLQARAERERQRALWQQSRAALLPTLDAAVDLESSNSSLGSRDNLSPSLTASYTVLDSGSRRADIAVYQARIEAADAELRMRQFELTVDALKAYLDLLEARDRLVAYRANEDALRESLGVIVARSLVGRATRVDVLQATSSLRQAEVETLEGKSTADLARLTLAQRMALPDGSMPPVQGLRSALREGVLSRPLPPRIAQVQAHRSVREAQALWRAAQQETRRTQASGRSKVVFAASHSRSSRPSVGEPRQSSRLTLTWSRPLFDGGDNRRAVEAAVLNEDKQRWSIDETVLEVEADIARAQAAFLNALATTVAARVTLESSEASLDARRGRYQAGVGTVADLLEAQRDTLDAERSLISAEYDALRALIDHLSANDDPTLFDLLAFLEAKP